MANYAQIRGDLLSQISNGGQVKVVLEKLPDQGMSWIEQAYEELSRHLTNGDTAQAQELTKAVAAVLKDHEGGMDHELADHRILRETVDLLITNIHLVQAGKDLPAAKAELERIASAVYCHNALRNTAQQWVDRSEGNPSHSTDDIPTSMYLTSPAESFPGNDSTALTGDLQLLSVPDLIEFLRSSRRTGKLVFRAPKGRGTINFFEGRIADASSPDLAASTSEADVIVVLKELVGWHEGNFTFDTLEEPKPGLDLETQGVLLEVLRQIDEQNRDK